MARATVTTHLVEWSRACLEALGEARSEIDALNVFPVPDSDTGTNVYVTVESGCNAVAGLLARVGDDADPPAVVAAFLDGVLMGARGNSGVILAQLFRAAGRSLLLEPGVAHGRLEPVALSRALVRAADAAYGAVARPVEGTMLTVARSAADAARDAAEAGAGLGETVARAAAAAREALRHTPEQLDRLGEAGVVDSGGRALVVVLDVTEAAITGRWRGDRPATPTTLPVPTATSEVDDGPAYEVMYLLETDADDAPDGADDPVAARLREALDPLGDSLVIIGGDGLHNVHVHVDDAGAAIEAGLALGRPRRIVVTHLAATHSHTEPEPTGRVVLLCAAGAGIASLVDEAGGRVLSFGPGEALVVDDFLGALLATGADEVIVLPNHAPFVSPAEVAAAQARARGVRVAVIPSVAQVQGLAALAVHDPGRRFDDDVVAMAAASGQTRHGAVTVAEEHAITMGGPCRPGDVLGAVGGDFAIVGDDLVRVALDVVERLTTSSTEIVTLVTGEACEPGLADAVVTALQDERPDVDTVVLDGGQRRYQLLVGAE